MNKWDKLTAKEQRDYLLRKTNDLSNILKDLDLDFFAKERFNNFEEEFNNTIEDNKEIVNDCKRDLERHIDKTIIPEDRLDRLEKENQQLKERLNNLELDIEEIEFNNSKLPEVIEEVKPLLKKELSEGQLKVKGLYDRGFTPHEMAKELNITPSGVYKHIVGIKKKGYDIELNRPSVLL